MKLKLCSLFSLAIAFAATPLWATTYYWKQGSTGGDYGTLSNWSTEGLSGADATVLPGSGDKLYYKGDYAFDLGGNTYEIGGWSKDSDSGARRTLSVVNGTLDNKGDWKPYEMTMTIGNGGTFVHSGGAFLPGEKSAAITAAITYVNVENGGTFTLTGACNPLNLYFNIASGGTFNFSPSYWGLPNKACASGVQFNNSGTLNMTSGMTIVNGAASADPFSPSVHSYAALIILFITLSASSWYALKDHRNVSVRMRSLPKGKQLAICSDLLALFMTGFITAVIFMVTKRMSAAVLPVYILYIILTSLIAYLLTALSSSEGMIDSISPFISLMICVIGGCFIDLSSAIPIFRTFSMISPAGLLVNACAGSMTAVLVMVGESLRFAALLAYRKRS